MDGRIKYISLFARLGDRIDGFGNDPASREAIRDAVAANPWFSEDDIIYAVRALREEMLREEVLAQWLSGYDMDYSVPPKKAGVIMAGNIPLVGFFDMMCVLACGYECRIKPSSKDTALMEYMAGLLKETDPALPLGQYSENERCDAVIATGSDNTNRYFRERFADIPSLLRGSRYSAAFMDGSETREQLAGLSDDIFRYNGMGCRSVSLLFLPRGYDVRALAAVLRPQEVNPKYLNNCRQARGLMTVQGMPFIDGGNFLLSEGRDFPSALAVVNYSFYDSPDEAGGWLAANDDKIQAVVSSTPVFPRHAAFGCAQRPAPADYPDGRDVIDFLIGLTYVK